MRTSKILAATIIITFALSASAYGFKYRLYYELWEGIKTYAGTSRILQDRSPRILEDGTRRIMELDLVSAGASRAFQNGSPRVLEDGSPRITEP